MLKGRRVTAVTDKQVEELGITITPQHPEASVHGRQHTLPVYGPTGLTQVVDGHVNHDPADPAVGYRVIYGDTSIVISGDTIITPGLIANSQDADLLVAATMNFAAVELMEEVARKNGDERQATLFFDIRDYLMDVSDVAELAQQANVERLALNHIAPDAANEIQWNQWFVNPIQEVYEGEIFAGGDGLTIVIPVTQDAGEQACSEQIASNDKWKARASPPSQFTRAGSARIWHRVR
jgi:ribonuclease BN (tRNA processing enzyme)